MKGKHKDLSVSRIKKAEREIVKFDIVLDSLMQIFPQSEEIWDSVGDCRQGLHVLLQLVRGIEAKNVDYSWLTERPLIDNSPELK